MQRFYEIGGLKLDIQDMKHCKPPLKEYISEINFLLNEAVSDNDAEPLIYILDTVANSETHLWISLALSIAKLDLSQHDPKFVVKILSDPEWEKVVPFELTDFISAFLVDTIDPIAFNWFHSGSNWVSLGDITQAGVPDPEDLHIYWSLIGNMTKCGVPLDKAFEIAGEKTKHPWLVLVSHFVLEGTQINPKSLSEEIISRLRRLEDRISKTIGSDFRILRLDLTYLDVGLEVGDVPEALLRLAARHRTIHRVKNAYLSSKVRNFFMDFYMLYDMGLPILRILRILQGAHPNLRSEIDEICNNIECGYTLSEAVENSNGMNLGDGVIIQMLKAAEAHYAEYTGREKARDTFHLVLKSLCEL
ncbi:MAG TPA: type II secretion system F family protein [Oligoflexia bacterium]|nr:type II secretion system F family protein [Oligoflexia bacterium]HMP49481.1 type II secretion system F family protein [Oligoflexia bacterium]